MKSTNYALLALAALIAACSTAKTDDSEEKMDKMTSSVPTLTMAWETDTTLITPESVIYDANNDVYYVSCIGAVPPGAQDGDGYIAKVAPGGEILANPWVSGLDGPKGMAISDGKLYVADIDKLVTIDIATGEIISKTLVIGATFLNDADADADGTIYLTDTENATLFMAKGDDVTEVLKNDELAGLNGVYLDGDRKVLAAYGAGKVYTLEGETLTAVADSIAGGDGVEKYKDGFFVSSWNGQVYYLASDWTKTKVLDTKAENVNAADIDVIESQNLLVVPTFFANKIVAYTIK